MTDHHKRNLVAIANLVRAAARAGNLDVAEWMTRQLLAESNRAGYERGRAACLRSFNIIRRHRRRAARSIAA